MLMAKGALSSLPPPKGRPPLRRCPDDFSVIFVEQGRVGCEAWYRARRDTVTRWMVEQGKERLIKARAAFVAHQRANGPWLTRQTPLVTHHEAKGNAARANASRLLTDANVSARVAELKARAAEKVIVTVADIAQQLDEDREFARKLNVPAAAVSATMGKAKVLGLLEDKTRVDITTAGRPLGLGDFYGNGSAGG
jgi:hypothetical protein